MLSIQYEIQKPKAKLFIKEAAISGQVLKTGQTEETQDASNKTKQIVYKVSKTKSRKKRKCNIFFFLPESNGNIDYFLSLPSVLDSLMLMVALTMPVVIRGVGPSILH